VGKDLGSYLGQYIVSGSYYLDDVCGFKMGYSADHHSSITWDGDGAPLALHTTEFGTNYNNTLALRSGNVGIGVSNPSEPLVVGNDLGSFSGNRIVVGDNTAGAQTGLVAGEDNDNRGWFLWDINGSYLSMGTRIGGSNSSNTLVLRDGNVGVGGLTYEDHRLYVSSAEAAVPGATAYFHNYNTDGIALLADNNSSDATAVFVQYGSGDVLRCFTSIDGIWHTSFFVTNWGRAICNELELLGGSDLAEPFEMSGETVPAGALVVIDDENPGKLKLSGRAYDTRVAGIVSGAGGIKPGLTLSQKDVFEGGQNVAINGRVYCLADASQGAIIPGDLLTTSDTPGHAMKAADRDRAYGAVIGKAMSRLDEGTGLVLVLVNLQ
jgi:hypothetical protein